MASDDEDGELEQGSELHPPVPVIEDEAEVFAGLRAHFPLSFGKQESKQTPLEAVHSSTKRQATDDKTQDLKNRFTAAKTEKFGRASSLKPILKPPGGARHQTQGNDVLVGPPRPPPGSNTDDGNDAIGPPRPPPSLNGDNESDVEIGPPRPTPGLNADDYGPPCPVGPPRPPPGWKADDDDGEEIGPPRPVGPPRPPPGWKADDDNVEEIGPPRPVGPTRPPLGRNAGYDDHDEVGPPRPAPGSNGDDSTDDEDGNTDEDDDDDDDDDVYEGVAVPMSNEIILKGHSKVVSALAVDPTGSRVLTGSYDYNVRMYDFQGMDTRLQSFRQLEPFEGHQVRALSWSPTADRFLCVTGSAQAKIYDRDGLTLGEFLRGDMYIRDLKNTKGHISGLTGGQWHPKEKQTILTSSEDGSLRVWDVTDFKSQKLVIKPKLARPGRVPVTTCAWGLDGKCVAGGLGNGSVQVWNVKSGWGSRPDIYIEKAHMDGEDVSGLTFSSDGRTLLSRSLDGTLKVWDLRSTKAAVKVFPDLPNAYQQTNVAFSPDEQLILTGTSAEKGGAGGFLYFFDKYRLELVRGVWVSPHSVVCCGWHQRLNQIFATTGDKKEGGTHILYDPAVSERGALVCVARAPRKKSVEDFEAKPVIHHPHALPLFRDEPSRKRQREKARGDPLKSKRPDLPVTGPGHGGRVGTTKGSLLTQYLLKEGGLMKEKWMEEDPREAILKYADVAAKEPKFIAPAYAETQPKTIYASSDSEDEK